MPGWDWVDKQCRALYHILIQAQFVNKRDEYSEAKFFFLKYYPYEGEVHRYYPRIGEPPVKYDIFQFPLPPKKLYEKYEEKRKSFSDSLIQDAISTIKKGKAKKLSYRQLVDYVADNAEEQGWVTRDKKGQLDIDLDRMRYDLNISLSEAYSLRSMAKRLISDPKT
jgi:hypothetical protein